MHTELRLPITQCGSHGILTVCPSCSAFAIHLGPTNPWLIIIAKETLAFRRAGISPALRLLVPTFLLLHAPEGVTPVPSARAEYSPTTPSVRRQMKFLISVLFFSPDYLRREISWWVSCYAFFQGWLLLSQPPHCRRNITTLNALRTDLGTLIEDPGCFPFDQWSLAPTVWLPSNLPLVFGVWLVWRGFPLSIPSSALPPEGKLNASPKTISERTSYYQARLAFHCLPQIIRWFCTATRFGPPAVFRPHSPCPWQDRLASGPIHTTIFALSHSVSLWLDRARRLSQAVYIDSLAHSSIGTPSPCKHGSDSL